MAKILIVNGGFYEDISAELQKGAEAELKKLGHKFETEMVPGAFEIPAVIALAIKTKKYDGYVALGCVIRGETSHYDYVCGESARGLNELAIKHGAAIGYGILTVENEKQAWQRADRKKGNKGADAVQACHAILSLKKKWKIDQK